MAIVNLTPDSFYGESRVENSSQLAKSIECHISEGADIIDLGAYSSRPGAKEITSQEEKDRLLPAVAFVAKHYPETIISIDTFRSEVAEAAINCGGHMINDISGGQLDESMYDLVGKLKVPYILMHMRGNPSNMQSHTTYNNSVCHEVLDYFQQKVKLLRKAGASDIILDPGFGFAKDSDQNFDLLRNFGLFKSLGLPLLAGLSRKSMIYKNLDITPAEALNGTTVLHSIVVRNGANILRVHDVKEAVELIKLFELTYKLDPTL